MDVQGARVVRPYVEKYEATFPVAVDTEDVLGQSFDLKAIPVSFLVDEVGIVRLRGAGPDDAFLRAIEGVLSEPLERTHAPAAPLPEAKSRNRLAEEVRESPEDWRLRLALARRCQSEGAIDDALGQLAEAARRAPQESSIHFQWGLALLAQGRQAEAVARLREALRLAPGNWRIHKQIWAIEHPDKFYEANSPDYGWQKEELSRERGRE